MPTSPSSIDGCVKALTVNRRVPGFMQFGYGFAFAGA